MKLTNIINILLVVVIIICVCTYTGQLINEKNDTLFKLGNLNVNRNAVIVLCFNFIVIGTFTLIYYCLSNFTNEDHFLVNGKPIKLTLFNALWVCLITQTTIGYGHTYYNTHLIRSIIMVQMSTLFINFGLFNL